MLYRFIAGISAGFQAVTAEDKTIRPHEDFENKGSPAAQVQQIVVDAYGVDLGTNVHGTQSVTAPWSSAAELSGWPSQSTYSRPSYGDGLKPFGYYVNSHDGGQLPATAWPARRVQLENLGVFQTLFVDPQVNYQGQFRDLGLESRMFKRNAFAMYAQRVVDGGQPLQEFYVYCFASGCHSLPARVDQPYEEVATFFSSIPSFDQQARDLFTKSKAGRAAAQAAADARRATAAAAAQAAAEEQALQDDAVLREDAEEERRRLGRAAVDRERERLAAQAAAAAAASDAGPAFDDKAEPSASASPTVAAVPCPVRELNQADQYAGQVWVAHQKRTQLAHQIGFMRLRDGMFRKDGKLYESDGGHWFVTQVGGGGGRVPCQE